MWYFCRARLHVMLKISINNRDRWAVSLWNVNVLFNWSGSDGAFTRTPESSTLIPRTLLRLNCGTNLKSPVLWNFTAEGSTSPVGMTTLGILLPNFTPYFYIDPSSQFDLVANTSNANESYCGTYTCVERRGAGDSRTATVASKCTWHSYVTYIAWMHGY